MNKRGIEPYFIVGLILSLIVLAIGMFWLFQEFFTEDSANKEVCQQSIILRNTLPNVDFAGVNWIKFKEMYPLKCSTNVITIDYKDKERAEKEIMMQMAECWNLFGQGQYNIYPSKSIFSGGSFSSCYPCARITFKDSVKSFYTGENEINIKDAMDKKIKGHDISYKQYLTAGGLNRVIAEGIYLDKFQTRYEDSNLKVPKITIKEIDSGDSGGSLEGYLDIRDYSLICDENLVSDYIIRAHYPIHKDDVAFGNSDSEDGTVGFPLVNIIHKNTGKKVEKTDMICKGLDYETFSKAYIIKDKRNSRTSVTIEIEETKKAFENIVYNIALPRYINPYSGDFFITISTLTYRTGIAQENNFAYTQLIFYQWDDDILEKLENKVAWPRGGKESEKEMLCSEWDGIMR